MAQIQITAPAPPLPPGQSEQGATGGWAPYIAPQQQAAPDQGQVGQRGTAENGGWAPYVAQEQKPQHEIGGGEAAMRGALDAITFGSYPAMAGAASGINSVMSGGDFSEPYNKTREAELQDQKQSAEQHPYIYGASEIAGSLPTLLIPGLGAEALGAKAVGTFGRLGRSVESGAAAGGLFGAGQQTSEGGSPADIAKGAAGGAAVGGVLGGALGGAIETGAGLGNRVMGIVRGAKNTDAEAGSRVVSALRADRPQVERAVKDKEAIGAGNEAGTPLTVADIGGENTKALLRSSANISPTARQTINETVQNRYTQQADRFATWIRSKFGSDKDADIAAIQAVANKANDPAYVKAYRDGAKGVWSPELQRLSGAPSIQQAIGGAVAPLKDRGIIAGYKLPRSNPFRPNPQKNGAMELRVDAKGNSPVPELAFWDQIVRNLNGRIGELMRAGNDTRARDIIQLKNELTAELDKLVPSYADARAGASKFFKAENAVEAGANFVKDGSLHDAEAARILAKMSSAERTLFQRGFASELAHQIERSGYRSNVLNSLFVNSPRAARRIKIALGEDGAAQFEGLMRIEGLIDRTRQALSNSTTVRQSHEAGLAAAGSVGLFESVHSAINPVYIIAGGIVLGGRAAAKQIDDKLAVRIAEMLMSDNPAELQRGYKIISGNPTIRTALRRASDLSGRQIINYLGPGGVAATGLTVGSKMIGHGSAPENPNHNNNYPDDAYGNGGDDRGSAIH